jgi:hypothetical protein
MPFTYRKQSIITALALLASLVIAPTVPASTIFVSSPMPTDTDTADSICTLREAVIAANNPGTAYHGCAAAAVNESPVIELPGGTYSLKSPLPAFSSPSQTTLLIGSGYNRTKIDAASAGSFAALTTNNPVFAQLLIYDVELANFNNAAIIVPTKNFVMLSYVRISGGTGTQGAIDNTGSFSMYSSEIIGRGDSTGLLGTGIRNRLTGQANVSDSSFANNRAEHGIIFNEGIMDIRNSTFGGNQDTSDRDNSIIENHGFLTIESSTFAFNRQVKNNTDPGVPASVFFNDGTLQLSASFVWRQGAGNNLTCIGGTPIQSLGSNVFDSVLPCPMTSSDSVTRVVGIEAPTDLMPIKHGGGAGGVYLPTANSPLFSHANDLCNTADQRGIPRANCASGAADVTNAVLMVRDSANRTAGDNNVFRELEVALGTGNVKVVGDTWTPSFPDPVTRLLVIAGSARAANVGTKFRDVGIGMVVMNSGVYKAMNMLPSRSGTVTNTRLLTVPRTAIAELAGFTSADYQGTANNNASVLNANASLFFTGTTGAEGEGLVPTSSGDKVIFTYFPGQVMENNGEAPKYRIGFMGSDSAAAQLSNSSNAFGGRRLLQEAAILGSSF